jgi:hypothetical protein
MATKLTDTKTGITATGVQAPNTLTKWPEFGATVTARLTAGTCTVQLRAWNDSSAKEILATFVLPVPAGVKAGDLHDSLPVFSPWDNFDYNVTAISGGGTLTMSVVGVGV